MGRPKKGAVPPRSALKTWSLRLSDDAKSFLDEQAAVEGVPRSLLAQRYIDEARLLRTEMAADWFELERQAKVEGVATGTVLGRMAKAALEKGKRK